MLVGDLKVGDVVIINVAAEGANEMEFETTVDTITPNHNCVLLKPIRLEGKLLNFGGDKLKITATSIINGKPTIWRSCAIQIIKHLNGPYHALVCRNKGVTVNRRNSFRVTVNERCHVNYGRATVEALCVDLSNTGFAFVIPAYAGENITNVVCSYFDTLLNIEVRLKGSVVRREARGEDKMLFGCKLDPKCDVEVIVSQRQRKLIQMR